MFVSFRPGLRGAVCALFAASLPACGGSATGPSGTVAGASLPSTPTAAAAATPRPGPPDIVVIMADDMGYGDLGVYGAPFNRTPQIDRLAAEGSRFDAMYVPTPICAPSRASLLTGRYGVRNGVTWNNDTVLRKGEVTVAELLRQRGYAAGIVGKWHLGAKVAELPLKNGFDFFYGMMSSPPGTDFVSGEAVTKDFPGMDMVTRRLTDEAVGFIRRTPAEKPLFLHFAHHAPHSPNIVSADFAGRSQGGPYGDAMEELDWSVGQIRKALEETGRSRNTFLVFLSDNGPVATGSPGPLTYGKGNINEGGIRVPAIVWQPGRVPAGRLIKDPASTLDFFPTFAGWAGAALPPKDYDGLDITRLLTGDVDRIPGTGIGGGREFYFFMTSEIAAVRSGKWKYVRPGFRDKVEVLYDIENDPGETNSLRRFNPEISTALDRKIVAFK